MPTKKTAPVTAALATAIGQFALTLPSGTSACVAEFFAMFDPTQWAGLSLPTRQQIGIEFRRFQEKHSRIGFGPGSPALRRTGKNRRQQTVYEVI